MERIVITNGKIITPGGIVEDRAVLVEKDRIAAITDSGSCTTYDKKIDARGNYISPGFVDIHTHGAGGYDFMDGTVEAFLGAAETHARFGTTTLLPTTLASTDEELKHTFSIFRKVKGLNAHGSHMPGLHLEGPYLSMKQRGAQDPRYLRAPEFDDFSKILSWSDDIIRWSAAPEISGAMEFGKYISGQGIFVSIAHSDAVYEEVAEAFKSGFTHVTHLYSGTSSVKRIGSFRYAGVIESAYLNDQMSVEIIADGCHLPVSLLKLVYKIKGPHNTALVTDSMRAAGQDVPESIMGSNRNGQRVIIEDGVAKLPDRSSFAGSVATADRLVRTMHQKAGIPLDKCIEMMTATPARLIGLGEVTGSIEPGKKADIVIFDEEISIKMTILNGISLFNTL